MWNVKTSSHFIVYFKEDEGDYVDVLIEKAEQYYDNITYELGFTRFDDFWLWEKRCKIYLYPSAQEYHRVTGQPEWSVGEANIIEKTIETYLYEKDFLENILPHEMGHLIFREFVGYKTQLPLWLDEGIACLQEKKHLQERLSISQGLVISGFFIPIRKLNEIKQSEMVMPIIFYAEAASIMDFLLEKYGKDKFIDFCRYLRDTKDWRQALLKVYGFEDLDQMNIAWVKFLSQDFEKIKIHN